MKRYFLVFVISLFTVTTTIAQTWHSVGTGGISSGEAFYNSLAIDPSGVPYVSFVDNNGLEVMKWKGTSWETVGNPAFENSFVGNLLLTIDKNGTPYVAYEDGDPSLNGLHGKLTVIKWNGSSWGYVGGSPGISDTTAVSFSIACDTGGTVYVAYTDGYADIYATPGPVVIEKFNGASWVAVGNTQPGTTYLNNAMNLSLAFDKAGNPYLAYTAFDGYTGASYVAELFGSDWQTIGNIPNVEIAAVADYISLAIDTEGTPYVAFQDGNTTANVVVNGNQGWASVGQPWLSDDSDAYFTCLAFDQNGIAYLAYEAGKYGPVIVKKHTGSEWVVVGQEFITAGEAQYISLAVDPHGTPYVTYADYNNNQMAAVMRFGNSTTGIKNISEERLRVYPNPSQGKFTVNFEVEAASDVQIQVIDLLDQTIYTEKSFAASGEISQVIQLNNAAKGIYLLELKVNGTIISKRISVE